MADFDTPQSRTEAILQNMLGAENVLEEPQSRNEELLQAILEQGGGGGTTDYNMLSNKPTINGVELQGDLSSEDIGVETPFTEEQMTALLALIS